MVEHSPKILASEEKATSHKIKYMMPSFQFKIAQQCVVTYFVCVQTRISNGRSPNGPL